MNRRAFGGSVEADLVEKLRDEEAVTLSLVATREHSVVGHILFSPVEVVGVGRCSKEVALGPMAVLPELQRRGVGSRLVERGLDLLSDQGQELVFVLGHPAYYPRFGFEPASRFGITCEYDAPDDAFMVRELRSGALGRVRGVVRYHAAFGPA